MCPFRQKVLHCSGDYFDPYSNIHTQYTILSDVFTIVNKTAILYNQTTIYTILSYYFYPY